MCTVRRKLTANRGVVAEALKAPVRGIPGRSTAINGFASIRSQVGNTRWPGMQVKLALRARLPAFVSPLAPTRAPSR